MRGNLKKVKMGRKPYTLRAFEEFADKQRYQYERKLREKAKKIDLWELLYEVNPTDLDSITRSDFEAGMDFDIYAGKYKLFVSPHRLTLCDGGNEMAKWTENQSAIFYRAICKRIESLRKMRVASRKID